MDSEQFKEENNYVEYPENTCTDCIHSSRERDGNGFDLYCNAGKFYTSMDGICDNFKK